MLKNEEGYNDPTAQRALRQKQLVKTLLCGNDGKLPCDNKECPYWVDQWHGIGLCNILKKQSDAATAIEELQAAEPTERQVVDYCHKRCLVVLEADLFHELKASYGKMPKRGEWIMANNDNDGHVKCSMCDKEYDWDTEAQYYNYCPNCGAKMTEVQDGNK